MRVGGYGYTGTGGQSVPFTFTWSLCTRVPYRTFLYTCTRCSLPWWRFYRAGLPQLFTLFKRFFLEQPWPFGDSCSALVPLVPWRGRLAREPRSDFPPQESTRLRATTALPRAAPLLYLDPRGSLPTSRSPVWCPVQPVSFFLTVFLQSNTPPCKAVF